MQITQVRVVGMSHPVPLERRHRTDLGTKITSDLAIIFVDTDAGLTGAGTGVDHQTGRHGAMHLPTGTRVRMVAPVHRSRRRRNV